MAQKLRATILIKRGLRENLPEVLEGELVLAKDTQELFVGDETGTPQLIVAAGSGGGSATLSGLTDVLLSSPDARQALIYDGTKWVNDGVLISDVASLQTALDMHTDDLDAETVARTSADSSLAAAIVAEAGARASVDGGIETDLASEISRAEAAEALLAPKASPGLTGTPTAPTPINATSSTQIATTAFVHSVITDVVGSAPSALDTLKELADAINDDANFAATVTTGLTAKAPLASPALTGTPSAPTAAAATNTTQIATCAFVESEIPLRSAVLSVAGRTGIVTLVESDISGLVADLALKAPLASPALTTPTISGAITMNGATSGTATLTAPAVAGTITNPFLLSNSLQLPSGTGLSFNGDVGLSRSSAGSMNLGNGTVGNATGTLILQTLTASGSVTVGAGNGFVFSGRSKLTSPSDGIVLLSNQAISDFTRLQLGGTTTSFPGFARSGTAVIQTLANGTAGGSFGAGGMTPVGIGTPTQIYNTPATSQTASIGATTMFTVGAADANFIAHFYLGQLNAGSGCSGAGSIGINVTFTDPITGNAYTVVVPIKTSGGTAFQTSLPLTNGTPAVANTGSAELRIRAKAATAIQFSTTYAAGASCSSGQAYNIYPDLEAL